jgi:hypothetical protein
MNSTVKFVVNMTVSTLIASSGAVALASGAASSTVNNATTRPTIEVRVYDYVHLERKNLQVAENEASRIFSDAGVSVRWVDCPTSHADVDAFPACSAPPSTVSNTLIILKGAGATGTRADYLIGETQGAHRATVFYSRMARLAGGDVAPADIVMGRLITHLVGRDLLGGEAYAKTGILQDFWSDEQLNEIAGTAVLFTPAQARRLVSRIDAQNQALASAQSPVNANGQ